MITPDDAVQAAMQNRGWSEERARDAIDSLLGCKWSAEAVYLGFRASFKCEYCHRDLLADADSYKMWERDHLIPQRAKGGDEPENLVLACSICNFKFKSSWDPRTLGETPDRAQLLDAASKYISSKRAETESEVAQVRAWVGYPTPRP